MNHKRSAIISRDETVARLFGEVLLRAGYDAPRRSEDLRVAMLGTYAPCVIMIDCDHLLGDSLESIRQLRFVLPDCSIAIASSDLTGTWARECHMAGASGVLSIRGNTTKMVAGLRRAIKTGCYTDPDFATVPRESQ